jgi:hypothetical protein
MLGSEKQGRSQKLHRVGWQSFFSAFFVPFKTGSEMLPACSGAVELKVLKVLMIDARQEGARNSIAWGRQKFFCAFLCLLKLEVKLFQCVAVRLSFSVLRFS